MPTYPDRPVDLVDPITAPNAPRLPTLPDDAIAAFETAIHAVRHNLSHHLAQEQPMPDLDTLKATVQDAAATNDAALADLAKHHGVQIEAASLTAIRLAELVEHILGDMDSPQRLLHELRIQELFATQIAGIRAQLVRAKLTAGVNGAALPPLGLKP